MTTGLDNLYASTLANIYRRTCRKCRHKAMRKHGETWICDWCRIEASERLWWIGAGATLYVNVDEARRLLRRGR